MTRELPASATDNCAQRNYEGQGWCPSSGSISDAPQAAIPGQSLDFNGEADHASDEHYLKTALFKHFFEINNNLTHFTIS